jgi:hypothetical protein
VVPNHSWSTDAQGTIVQETRDYDGVTGSSQSLRSKEEAQGEQEELHLLQEELRHHRQEAQKPGVRQVSRLEA